MSSFLRNLTDEFLDYTAIFGGAEYLQTRNKIIFEREKAERVVERKKELHRLRDEYHIKYSAALRDMTDWEGTFFEQAPGFPDHYEWLFEHDFLKSETKISQYDFKCFLERWRDADGGESQREEGYMRPDNWRVLFLPRPNKAVQVDLQYRNATQLITWGIFSAAFDWPLHDLIPGLVFSSSLTFKSSAQADTVSLREFGVTQLDRSSADLTTSGFLYFADWKDLSMKSFLEHTQTESGRLSFVTSLGQRSR